jgi:hypothetical protein
MIASKKPQKTPFRDQYSKKPTPRRAFQAKITIAATPTKAKSQPNPNTGKEKISCGIKIKVRRMVRHLQVGQRAYPNDVGNVPSLAIN